MLDVSRGAIFPLDLDICVRMLDNARQARKQRIAEREGMEKRLARDARFEIKFARSRKRY
jgi:hypothetical protein